MKETHIYIIDTHEMAMLVADLLTDDIGINILSLLDHKTELKFIIK